MHIQEKSPKQCLELHPKILKETVTKYQKKDISLPVVENGLRHCLAFLYIMTAAN